MLNVIAKNENVFVQIVLKTAVLFKKFGPERQKFGTGPSLKGSAPNSDTTQISFLIFQAVFWIRVFFHIQIRLFF